MTHASHLPGPLRIFSIFNSHRTSVSFSSFSCPYLRIPPHTSSFFCLPSRLHPLTSVHPPPLPSPPLPPSLLPVRISIPFSPGWSERGVCGCLLLAGTSCNPSSAHCFIQQFFDPLLISTHLCLSSVPPHPQLTSPPQLSASPLPLCSARISGVAAPRALECSLC